MMLRNSPESRPAIPRAAWTTDRCGRLLAGSFVLSCMALAGIGWLPVWLACAAAGAAGAQLVATSLVGWCPLQQALRRLGVKEREEVLLDLLQDQRLG